MNIEKSLTDIESLNNSINQKDTEIFLSHVEKIVRKQKYPIVARRSSLGRESLYKIFSKKQSHAQFRTVLSILHAIGYKLVLVESEIIEPEITIKEND
jgi:probable addiction module antidote protein